MVLICLFLCRSVSLPLFIFPPPSSAYATILISISSIVLRLISSGLFPSCLHPLPVSQSRRVPPALALPLLFFFPSSSSSGLTTSQSYPLPCFSRSLYVFCLCPDLHSPSLPLAIFLHLELSLSCLFSISRPSVNPSGTPSLSYLSFSSGHSSSPRSTCSCFTSPLLFFSPSSSSSGLSISPGLAPPSPSPSPSPSPQGYTSLLQMFCPSQI